MTQAWFLLISTIPVDARAILVKTLMAGCSFRWNLNYFSGNIKCISAQSSLHCISPIMLANLLSLLCWRSAVIDVFFWLYLVLFYKNSPILDCFSCNSVFLWFYSQFALHAAVPVAPLWDIFNTNCAKENCFEVRLQLVTGTQINSIFKSNFVNWRDFPIWWEYFSCALCHWSGVLQLWIVLYCYIKDVTVMRWFESFCVVLLWWF